MSAPLNVYFQSLKPERHKERDFYIASLRSEKNGIALADNPEASDWNLLTDVLDVDEFDQVPTHELIQKYPNKTLVLTESDEPIELWPGLYTCGLKNLIDKNLIHGWDHPYHRVRFPNEALLGFKELEPVKKKHLASFVGYPSHTLRKKIYNIWKDHPDIYFSIRKGYNHFVEDNKIPAATAQQDYLNTIRSSHFSLCPRGRGHSSIRIFESMQLGVAPVIIADNWLPPSYVDWASCSVFIRENQIKDIHDILNPLIDRSEEMGKHARKIYLEHFAPKCLGQSLQRALHNLSPFFRTHWDPTNYDSRKIQRNRKFRFKLGSYNALVYSAKERLLKRQHLKPR